MKRLTLSTCWTIIGLFCHFSLLLITIHVLYGPAQTPCCEPPLMHPSTPRFPQGATVKVWLDMTSGFTAEEAFHIEYGLEDWNTQPNSSGVRFDVQTTTNPPTVGPNTPNVVVATYIDEVVTWNGGSALTLNSSGSNVYGTLRFWKNMRQVSPDFINQNWRSTARHEAGHGLGLDNGDVDNKCTIGTTIMFPSWNGETFITECDNRMIDTQLTIYQPTPTPTPTPCAQQGQSCTFSVDCCPGYVCGDVTNTCYPCEPDLNHPQKGPCMSEACSICYEVMEGTYCDPWTSSCWTPIIIDVSGNGIEMTSAEDGVWFDGFGHGVKILTAWPKQNVDDAWLALDRNSNGLIDDGTELFSSAAAQPILPPPDLKHGFNALAQYDKIANGGNADRVIDRNDSVFTSLLLWQDINHNGISEAFELHNLQSLGLESISIDYKLSKRKDRHGNVFRYRAKVTDIWGIQMGRWAYDVYPVTLPKPETLFPAR